MKVSPRVITFSPVEFHCRQQISNRYEEWKGLVKHIKYYGSHYEIHIESRSGFILMVGEYINGHFISIPAFGIGCDMAGYGDYFWNNEQLSQLMNPVDAATIAQALQVLSINKYIS